MRQALTTFVTKERGYEFSASDTQRNMFLYSQLSNQSCTKRGQQFFFFGIYFLLRLSSQALAEAQRELGQPITSQGHV